MSAFAAWLDRNITRSPATLAERTRSYALGAEAAQQGRGASVERTSGNQPSTADMLVNGARHALSRALAHPADRSAALDLLAGDALVTLALLAQAEEAPQELGAFARTLLCSERLFS